MLTEIQSRRDTASGYTLIEVLVAMIVLAIGVLGLASLMAKMHQSETEAYQRAQALILLQEMSGRVLTAGTNAVNYVTAAGASLGTGDGQPASCAGLAGVALDQCFWSNNLKGGGETGSSGSVGAMIGGRGCVEQIVAPDPTPLVCTPGLYRVSVVWQGLTPTSSQVGIACGTGNYGPDDALRRVVSTEVTIGLPLCI